MTHDPRTLFYCPDCRRPTVVLSDRRWMFVAFAVAAAALRTIPAAPATLMAALFQWDRREALRTLHAMKGNRTRAFRDFVRTIQKREREDRDAPVVVLTRFEPPISEEALARDAAARRWGGEALWGAI